MKSHRGMALIAPLVIVTALLAGCTAATPTASPSASAGGAPTTSASPTPTPTPTPVADPSKIRVPFDCDALYTATTAKSVVGTKLTASGGQDAPITNLSDVAQRQAGALDCLWSGGFGTEVGPSNYLAISVAPDAADDYDKYVAGSQPTKYHPVTNTAGDKSSYYCRNGGALAEGYSCSGQLVVGDYWVAVSMIHVVPVTPAVVSGLMQKAMKHTAAVVAAASPVTLPAWPVPSGPATSFCSGTGSTAKIQAATGDSTMKLYKSTSSREYSASNVGYTGGVYADCFWESKKYGSLNFSILDGGAWAFPAIQPEIPIDSTMYGQKFTSKKITGASSALIACDKESCEAYLAVDDEAVQIDASASTKAQTVAWMSKLVAAIRAS